jgi:puromycin-sensitive aminopeptidase
MPGMTVDPYRLPRSVTPSHYELAIAPDLRTCRFEGTTAITLTVHEPVREVVLNALELELHSAVLTDSSGRQQEAVVTLDEDLERATLAFATPLATGEATLTITSTGTINDRLRGFYRSTYTDADGVERVIATTQFESTDARRAFPCWDEPEHKATFRVSLLVPDGLLGLSNTSVIDERPTEGGTWVEFDTTMKMSTYLVAFIVGPLVTTEPVDVDGVPLRVACVPGREHLTAFAIDVGVHAVRFLSEYFAIPYPSDKLDLVALPDFAFGAMENLGCVTFRETSLLIDPEHASRVELERVADVVAHEIAHMWFGDLVTMKWWNGIWLNEAFATFMELATVHAYRPGWERWVSFSTERGMAMVTDGLASTRPIEYEVVSPDDAEGMFDVLTYQKGGAVLRMLETYLGAAHFREGIRLYLDRHRYGNTETTDLWDAIEEASGEPVRAIMDSWIFQGGHPVVSVSSSERGVVLRQQRFRYIPDPSDADQLWQIPTLLRRLSGEHGRVLLSGPSTTVGLGGDGPAVVNAGGWGVFRTQYAPALFADLIAHLGELDALERYSLVSDTWAAVLAGPVAVGEFLDLVALLGNERDPNVWDAALDGIGACYRALAQPASFSAWVRSLIGPVFERLGWQPVPGESDSIARLRGLLVQALGTIGADEAVVAQARAMHADGTAPPDLLTPVVSIIAWNGGPEEYEMFWERIRGAATPLDEVRYLFRLPMFPAEDLLLRTLDATLDGIRTQNGAFVIAAALANRTSGPTAWSWLTEHWHEILKRMPENSRGRMLEGIVRLTDPKLITEVAAFLAEHELPNARKQVAQLLERQKINGAFVARNADVLAPRFP